MAVASKNNKPRMQRKGNGAELNEYMMLSFCCSVTTTKQKQISLHFISPLKSKQKIDIVILLIYSMR